MLQILKFFLLDLLIKFLVKLILMKFISKIEHKY